MAKPTINDVARIAGVSKKTVSRFINKSPLISDDTRARIAAAVAELDFVPNPQARALALRHGFMVALVDDGADPALTQLALEGMRDALHHGEHALAICPVARDPAAMMADLRTFVERHRPFGLVLMPSVGERTEIVQSCAELGCGFARIGNTENETAEDQMDGPEHAFLADEGTAAARALGHLVMLGHNRIGIIAGNEDSPRARAREAACLAALERLGLGSGPALVAYGDDTFASGIEAADLLLEVSPRPTAIIALHDEMAAGVLHAAAARGIAVPHDLSVVGFGNLPVAARTLPPLASVDVPIADMARAAARSIVCPEDAATLPRRFTGEFVARPSLDRAPG